MLGTILPAIQLYTYKIIPQEYYTAVVSGMTVDSTHLLFFFLFWHYKKDEPK